MISNFFKTALRVLWRRKTFSFINILGLAVGIAASLLIFLVIQNELNYDAYHSNGSRIYRIVTNNVNRSNGEIGMRSHTVPAPMPDALKQDFPQAEKVGAIWGLGQAQVYVPVKGSGEERRFKENEGIFWADPIVFEMFNYIWVAGNASRMTEPNTVVLNETLARKFFDDPLAAIGKTLQIWSFRIPLNVVGVFKDLPKNTDMPLMMTISSATLRKLSDGMFTHPEAWDYPSNGQCFILAPQKHDRLLLQSQLNSFIKKFGKQDPLYTREFVLQPLRAMHLNKDYETFRNDAISKNELWSLASVGIFLLLVACINFINLSTAQSVNRAKEIGVRKVLGSNRSQLLRQFMQETAFVTVIALITGCLLALAGVPLLNKIMNKGLSLNFAANPTIIFYLLLMGVLVTFLAGLYPALVLSGFSPALVFRNKLNPKMAGGISLRRALVVFQFVIAQLLIIGTVVVVKQMKYFRERPLGFDKDGIVLINLPSDSSLKVKYPMLKSRMEQIPGVLSASLCMEAPSNTWAWNTDFTYDNETQKKDFPIIGQFADTGYYKTFGIMMAAGRHAFHSDTARELVVNEALIRKLGLSSPQEILGKNLLLAGFDRKMPVVGVIKDYNSRTLREAIQPLVITTASPIYEWIAVRIQRENMSTTLEKVRTLFTGIYPTYIYDQVFFNERLERFYENEAITAQLFKLFSSLAIFISCLGLYGLVSFMAVQKTKEVGIRKVLGASVQSIVFMFSREFTLLIIVAFAVAAPVGYYFMNNWLSGFHYHTSIDWVVFAMAIIFSMIIAWVTVGYKAVKAALANPVKSLKTE